MAERQFGPYRLVRQVAVGGMAEIHLAKAKGIAGFEKYVALKMIHPNFAEDEAFIQMLIDEAKIAVQLQHVNIAQTFDLGRVGDQYYITMEYVDGSDLYKILRRGSEQDLDVPLDVCAFVAKEVATGLDYAHRKKDMAGSPLGIVHRDVSPQNVLVSHAGEVKIVDFGIAKATMKVRQTAAGVIKGKYYYMSPEQAWGDKLDHRSDIFSAGIVLYEMMTGQMLYLEEDLHRLLDMVRKADIAPPSTLRRDVPPQLERITMHALSKVAGERYQHAADMANDLERFLHSYSPVFTAAKLARHLRAVMGDPLPIQTAPEPSVDPVIQTLEIGDEELVHDRTDLRGDENSVIFRLDGLKPGADRPGAGANRAAAPGPAVPRSLGGPQPGSGKIPSIAPVAGRPPAPAVRAPTPQPAPQLPSAPVRPGPLRPPPGQKMELPRITQRKPGGTQPPPITVPPKPIVGPQSGATTAPLPAPTTDSLGVPVPSPQQPTKPARPPSRPPGVPRDPLEQTRPVDARMLAASTWAMEDHDEDLDGIGERTMITEPPGFDAGSTSAPADDVGFEPTTIEEGWSSSSTTSVPDPDTADDEDDAPTLAPSGRDDSDATTTGHHDPDEDGPTMTRNEAVRRAGPAPGPAPAQPTVPVRKPRSPANPALAASTPTPAVSEVRKPQRSRRTPAGGVPGGPAGGSVLQAMINAAGSEPMPTRVAPGRGGPSDGVPPLARDGGSGPMAQPHGGAMHQPPPHQPPQHQPPPHQQPHYQQQPPPQQHQQPQHGQGYPQNQPPQPYDSLYPVYPQNQQPPPQQGAYPGQHPVPVNMPPHLQPYGWPAQAPYTPQPGAGGQGLPPGIANQAGPYPFQPYSQQGAPQNMPTFTQQMRAVIELDEIPSQYKVGHGGPRWFVLAIAALIAVAGAAVVTYFLLRRNTEAKVTAVLLIDSVPGGGTVVIDNEQLPHPTPVPYSKTSPGQRHHIKISAAGHRTYEDDIVVPTSGGEYRISPVLQAITGKIHVETTPPGADVFIKGDNRGRTPVDLVDIEIGSTIELELRHKDFGTRTVPLKWPENGEIRLDIDLKK